MRRLLKSIMRKRVDRELLPVDPSTKKVAMGDSSTEKSIMRRRLRKREKSIMRRRLRKRVDKEPLSTKKVASEEVNQLQGDEKIIAGEEVIQLPGDSSTEIIAGEEEQGQDGEKTSSLNFSDDLLLRPYPCSRPRPPNFPPLFSSDISSDWDSESLCKPLVARPVPIVRCVPSDEDSEDEKILRKIFEVWTRIYKKGLVYTNSAMIEKKYRIFVKNKERIDEINNERKQVDGYPLLDYNEHMDRAGGWFFHVTI